MLEHTLILKSDELYLVGDAITDGSSERASGLYLRDTRYLDLFDVRLNGLPLKVLSIRPLAQDRALIVSANDAMAVFLDDHGDAILEPLTVSIAQHIRLARDLEVRFLIENFSNRTLSLVLSIALRADFRDLFDIRGFPRQHRGGAYRQTTITEEGLAFHYVDRLGTSETTVATIGSTTDVVVTTPAPDDTAAASDADLPRPPSATVTLPLVLGPGEHWDATVSVLPLPPGEPSFARARDTALASVQPARVVTDNPFFNRVLDRAAADLAMLETTFPGGSLPAAGAPWFVAPFGRDSLIVGLQTMHLAPQRAMSTLRFLAALQGTAEDPFREEEPGKILHEIRYGEMARLGEIPHTPYYGSIDATPLFILLFAELVVWSGDDQLFDDVLPNVRRALEWVTAYGDLDGDGLIEYRTRAADGQHIVHQSWKDSNDSLHHRDGRPASGMIAPVEVQGYLYAAYCAVAKVLAARGYGPWADELRQQAEVVRTQVETHFWIEKDGYYAQALDGDKTPVAALSSNPGHLLYCGLPTSAHAQAVASRMRQPDLDSGWGIRSLSAEMPTYNPMSYHNGSVWPHDNSLIVAGMRRYGLDEDVTRIASALFAVAEADPLMRLPELYCGFPRTDAIARIAPVPYPVSCSPQAWAAAASQLVVRTLLGLQFDARLGTATVDPVLPSWLNEISIQGLTVAGESATLRVQRTTNGYHVETQGPIQRMPDPDRGHLGTHP